MSLWNDEQERPLQHLRIIDMTLMLTGPYLTRILAQYGADVVKVEQSPEGDPLRALADSALFEVLNQGKKSLAVNLKEEAGIEIVKKLASEADVFIENLKEGTAEKMGLGYAELSELNPDLIYVSLRGFSGRNASKAGHDLNFVSTSGCGEWFLENPNYSAHFADIIGGTFLPAMKLLMHLSNPVRTGMHLISNMDEGFRSLYLGRAFEAVKAEKLSAENKENFGSHHYFNGKMPHSRYYKCKDGKWISLQAIQVKHWVKFCEIVNKKEWLDRSDDNSLTPEMEALFLKSSALEWEALTEAHETCLFRVVSWEEHLGATDAKLKLETDPLSWAGFMPVQKLKPCPNVGDDTFTTLNSMGYSNKDIADFMSSKTVFQRNK